MPHLDPRQAPPPDYYADNLSYLLLEVARRNADLLTDAERRFLAAWQSASARARRLFARLLSRKGPWYRCDRLTYAEVGDAAVALAELRSLGLVCINPPAAADQLLALFTRAELGALFPRVRAPTKPAWIAACVTRYTDAAVRARLQRAHPWVAIAVVDALAVCRLLFFGDARQDLTDFILQDLGVLRFEAYEIGPHTRPFATRDDISHYQTCRALAAWLAEQQESAASAAAIGRQLWAPAASRSVARLRDRLLNRLGYLHERRGDFDEALECYGLSSSHPARERRARLLKRLGDQSGSQALMAEAAAMPWSAAEEDFALRSTGAAAAAAPPVTEVCLDGLRPAAIEQHALAQLTADGGRGWHLENHLPLGLAGLVFWDEIFAPAPGAFSHRFQQGPRDLFWPDFARVRGAAIERRVAQLRGTDAFRAHVERVFDQKQGISNRLVHWGLWQPALLAALLDQVPAASLLALSRHVIGQLERARTGFPDLLVIRGPNDFEFVEVKGPTDQLQPAQRTWLRRLAALGLPARVLKYRP